LIEPFPAVEIIRLHTLDFVVDIFTMQTQTVLGVCGHCCHTCIHTWRMNGKLYLRRTKKGDLSVTCL